ncbi:MAG TPA: hypothetical protein VM487_16955 [Phycisphaerae bacterium]|nr:hypothetical protein [Phycisphaerae bacterium]
MSSVPAVIVRKGGFLNGLFYGFFGFLITTVICATGVGIYGMRIADSKVVQVLSTTERLVTGVPDWLDALFEVLPPAMADALHDRRDPDYREHVDVAVRLVPGRDHARYQRAAIEVTNNGTETISLMALRIVIVDEDGVPAYERAAYVATPLTIEDEWRGPLLPGSTRKFAITVRASESDEYQASYEIAELRVWDPDAASSAPAVPEAPAAADAPDAAAAAVTSDAESAKAGPDAEEVEAGGSAAE